MFDRYHSSIMPTIHQTGGYRPPVRKRHRLALSSDEREEISRGLVAKISIRAIANKLSRAPSTISREIKRHGGAKQYRAAKADTAAWGSALRPKPYKLIESPTLCKIIAEKMHQDWSPEQITGCLKRCYPDNQEMHVSHETIYKTLFIQTRGALKKELQQCLRSGRTVRRSALLQISRRDSLLSHSKTLHVKNSAYQAHLAQGDPHNKMLRPGLCVVHASPKSL